MNEITVKKLALTLGISIERLIIQLNKSEIKVNDENDIVSGQQQLQLKLQMMKQSKVIEKKDNTQINITLDDICNATGLLDLNHLLTQLMAKQQIQTLLKEESLSLVVDSIITLSSNTKTNQSLLAAAMLGRLAAVARGRENQVTNRVAELFSDEPPSLDSLSDISANSDDKEMDLSKIKQYAAQSLRDVDASWVNEYCIREAIKIDAAGLARQELLEIVLKRLGKLSDWLILISKNADEINSIESLDVRLTRVRRILGGMLKVVKDWQGDLGDEPGDALTKCFTSLVNGKLVDADQESLHEVVESTLSIVVRFIELRFSYALYGQTYSVIDKCKGLFAAGMWQRFLDNSVIIDRVRIDLLESALVLARQNRTDIGLMGILLNSYSSKSQITAAVKRHFLDAQDLEPDVYKWWQSASKTTGARREVEHRVGNTEDEHIGQLLIEVEYAEVTMKKLNSAVVPMLEISDPVLASTVTKAAKNYEDMAQITRRLARMRKLSQSGLLGQQLEYNQREHEMEGGHQAGIRYVRVISDGIRKDFNGKVKTLVKPVVEPVE
jgi:hypothetical protein